MIGPDAVHDIEYDSDDKLDIVLLYVFREYMRKANGNLQIFDEFGQQIPLEDIMGKEKILIGEPKPPNPFPTTRFLYKVGEKLSVEKYKNARKLEITQIDYQTIENLLTAMVGNENPANVKVEAKQQPSNKNSSPFVVPELSASEVATRKKYPVKGT